MKMDDSNYMRTIGNFIFDYETDIYKNEKDIQMDIYFVKDHYIITFKKKSERINVPNKVLIKAVYENNFDNLVKKIEEYIKEDEYKEWESKENNWIEAPELPSEEKIKEMIHKSNSIELNFLQNKSEELEKRIEILEDSVEDLQNWRHR